MNFKSFYFTEVAVAPKSGPVKKSDKNTPGGAVSHLDHIEDVIIQFGKAGFKRFVNDVDSVLDFLVKDRGDTNTRAGRSALSEKIDGAPAIFFGKDPNDGRFFVATKSLLNVKTPKINHTVEEINKNHSGELATKLKVALRLFPSIYFGDKIYQSDLLFTKGDKSEKKINGKNHIVFRPNTIVYAVPEERGSDLFKRINSADIGAVVHTVYEASPRGDGGIEIKQLDPNLSRALTSKARSKKVYIDHPFHEGIENISISKKEENRINSLVKRIGKSSSKINSAFDKAWVGSKTKDLLMIYLNSQVRESGGIFKANVEQQKFDFGRFADGFEAFLGKRFEKETLKLKNKASREEKEAQKSRFVRSFRANKKNFEAVMTAFFDMLSVKNILLREFENIQSKIGKTFVQDGESFKATRPEGFVLVSGKGVVKMVDRLEFSRINFLFGAFK